MKLVTREQLLKITDKVMYSEYDGEDFGEDVSIKYSSTTDLERNNFTTEPFPIMEVDLGKGNYYLNLDDFKQAPIGTEFTVSDFETLGEGTYEDMGKLYILYSKEDIQSWINKLNELL